MSPPKGTGIHKRSGSPLKSPQGHDRKVKKSLSFEQSDEMEQSASGLGLEDGGAHGPSMNMAHWGKAPQWFTDFERRQDKRFADMAGMVQECKDIFEAYKLEFDNLTDEVETLKKRLEETEIKLDDIENRSRRNNVVVFNLPEGEEEGDCQKFFGKLLENCNVHGVVIQRAHRTGRLRQVHDDTGPQQQASGSVNAVKPHSRPIHLGFACYQEKECRKGLAELFKQRKFGLNKDIKLFAANDYSQRVQKLRKAKIPELQKLRAEGKQAFLVYPATIKIRDGNGRVRDA